MIFEEIFDCSNLIEINKVCDYGNIPFPHDYKSIISKYGGICINNFLYILSPDATNTYLNSEYRFTSMRDAFYQTDLGIDFRFFDGKDGLYPWGITDNGDELYWEFGERTQVVIFAARYATYVKLEMSLTEVLREIFINGNTYNIIPDDLFLEEVSMVQY